MYLRTGNQATISHRSHLRPHKASRAVSPANASLQQLQTWLRLEGERRQIYGQPGRIDSVIEWDGSTSSYRYDERGDLIEIVEPDGQTWRYGYDNSRRLISVLPPDGDGTFYTYSPEGYLSQINDRGVEHRYRHDPRGRLVKVEHGHSNTATYKYDANGRLAQARTAEVTDRWEYDSEGKICLLEQSFSVSASNGAAVQIELAYDQAGCLASMILPGSRMPVRYTWDATNRPQTISLGDQEIARFTFDDPSRTTIVSLANGIEARSTANCPDGRPLNHSVNKDSLALYQRQIKYGAVGEIFSDGARSYTYDPLGRLVWAEEPATGRTWTYSYDSKGNRLITEEPGCVYDRFGRLTMTSTLSGASGAAQPGGKARDSRYDTIYLYDDAGRLVQVRRSGAILGNRIIARFTYDFKGRLALAELPEHTERYVYGPADELLAITDHQGQPLRLFIRGPLGVVAEVHGTLEAGTIYYRHDDEQGSARMLTSADGQIMAFYEYDPFGLPLSEISPDPGGRAMGSQPVYCGRNWIPEVGLYYFGSRWYDPRLGRFLTPDSYSGAPDDERLVNPYYPADQQAAQRAQILNDWLKQPRLRNRYAFCQNDPIGHVDPNGHWSFGGVLLMLLGAIWTLPNTLFGLLIEITCLVGEVLRWIVWLFSGGNVTWQTPGFDVAASGNLNAFALVFKGGWLGSFPSLLGITFGNVFFVYGDWENSPYITELPDTIHPVAYDGEVAIPRDQVLYEHELRHTNQYGWFGPFFHLGLPIWGFYLWDVILHGYRDAWSESDARRHSEEPYPSPDTTTTGESGEGSLVIQASNPQGDLINGVIMAQSATSTTEIPLDEMGRGVATALASGNYTLRMGEYLLANNEVANNEGRYEDTVEISGKVTLETGSLPVTVSLYLPHQTEPLASVTTAADGTFVFHDLPAGEYRVAIPNYEIGRGEGTE